MPRHKGFFPKKKNRSHSEEIGHDYQAPARLTPEQLKSREQWREKFYTKSKGSLQAFFEKPTKANYLAVQDAIASLASVNPSQASVFAALVKKHIEEKELNPRDFS